MSDKHPVAEGKHGKTAHRIGVHGLHPLHRQGRTYFRAHRGRENQPDRRHPEKETGEVLNVRSCSHVTSPLLS